MSRVDVSDIILDPDFASDVTHIKRTSSINSLGENILSECCIETFGSVQPASGKSLLRVPESLRMSDVKSFWIKGSITATSPGKYSDVLVFKGKRFQVKNVMDWSYWGEGFAEGLCVEQEPAE